MKAGKTSSGPKGTSLAAIQGIKLAFLGTSPPFAQIRRYLTTPNVMAWWGQQRKSLWNLFNQVRSLGKRSWQTGLAVFEDRIDLSVLVVKKLDGWRQNRYWLVKSRGGSAGFSDRRFKKVPYGVKWWLVCLFIFCVIISKMELFVLTYSICSQVICPISWATILFARH